MRQTAVHFGADFDGRAGFGEAAARAGFDVVFVEPAGATADALRAHRKYAVETVRPRATVLEVLGVRVVDADAVAAAAGEVAVASFVSISSGADERPGTAAAIASGLASRWVAGDARPLAVLVTGSPGSPVRLHDLVAGELGRLTGTDRIPARFAVGGETLDAPTLLQRVAFAGAVATRLQAGADAGMRRGTPPQTVGEEFRAVLYDGAAARGCVPAVAGLVAADIAPARAALRWVQTFAASALGFVGLFHGYRRLCEAAGDRKVRSVVKDALEEIRDALDEEFPGAGPWLTDAWERVSDERLALTVSQVCADQIHRLGPDGEISSAAKLVRRRREDIEPLARVLDAAVSVEIPGDAQSAALRETVRHEDFPLVLERVCGLANGDGIYEEVLRIHKPGAGAS